MWIFVFHSWQFMFLLNTSICVNQYVNLFLFVSSAVRAYFLPAITLSREGVNFLISQKARSRMEMVSRRVRT